MNTDILEIIYLMVISILMIIGICTIRWSLIPWVTSMIMFGLFFAYSPGKSIVHYIKKKLIIYKMLKDFNQLVKEQENKI